MKSLRHGQVASIGERRLHELLLDTEVLESVRELGIGNLDETALQRIGLLCVQIEAHDLNITVNLWHNASATYLQPIEVRDASHLLVQQLARRIPLVHEVRDLKERGKHGISCPSRTSQLTRLSIFFRRMGG